MNTNKRWLYLGMGTLTLLFLGLIYAWSIFRTPFGEMFPDWSISQLSMTFTISMIFFCLGGFAGGVLSKKLSLRIRLLVSAVMLLVGFFAVSMVKPESAGSSLMILYFFYGVFGGGGVGFAYNGVIGALNKWFPDKVGLASGIMLMGFGLGGLVLGSVVNSMIGSMGLLPVFKILGVVICIVCALAAFIIKVPDEKESAELAVLAAAASKDKAEETVKEEAPVKNYTAGEMLRTSRFWFFTIWAILLNSAGLLVINSAANISVAFGGTAVLGMIVSLFNGAGRIVAGNNFDKFGRFTSTLVNNAFMLAAGILLTLGGFTGAYVFILCGLVFVGLAYGGCPTITSAYVNKAFGPANFPTNFSIANFSLIPAATIGPMISSALLESAGGSYNTNFYAIVGFSALAAVFWVLLNRASKGE
ncbi:MAG: MFS transporter [Mogibacterium sp.]|nr:MFS transporter [Mogibacterium sp.]